MGRESWSKVKRAQTERQTVTVFGANRSVADHIRVLWVRTVITTATIV